jgi:hypothetical protein
MSNENMPKWSNIRKCLLLLDKGELVALAKDLYTLSAENRRFLNARFTQEQDQVKVVLADYKQEITYFFFGKRGFSDDLPRLREARKLVRVYQKASKDLPGTLDLKLHYVETGTEFTNTYGDIDESFYGSLESVLADFCEDILQAPDPEQVYARFAGRLIALERATYEIGWGYGDAVQELLRDLVSHIEGR